ncbi:ABC transporter substrate-binding protein [Klebsiella pneumoniae]|nr:ABC transporter substrate-binding protein [Klebsiella pneumoniae]
MNRALMTLVLSAFAMDAAAALDLRANEQPLPVTRDPQAIAKIPPGYRFVEPGTLTVAISALNSPPLALLASDNRTRIGSDPDIARLLAGSLGLKLRLVPTAWEDWPLGIASGRYDVALINIAVTEKRKEKFDFATYRVDSLAFSVKSTSDIAAVNGPADLAGRKVIVGSGTNQERILLGWNEDNRAAGRPQAQPVYLTDDASGNLYIQSGRADIFFGPQSVAAYKAALNGQTGWWAWGRKKRGWRQPPKKAMAVFALQAALDGAIARGEYQQVLARWGAGRSGGAVGGQPAGDNLLTPVAWCAGWVSGKFLPTLRLYPGGRP